MVDIILVAGHRSVGDGGSPVERELTDDSARAFQTVFKGAGFPVTWINPTMYPGGLDGLALATGRALAARRDRLSIMFDLHFNQLVSPVHTIVAHNRREDGSGPLSTAYPQGRVLDDVSLNNPLDVTLARAISANIASIPGMTLRRDTGSGAGVMRESETGVGGRGYRLAMMAATAPYRTTAVRLTVEQGGTSDASKPDFFNQVAKATLRAVQSVMAGRDDAVTDTDAPEGDAGLPSLPAWLFGEADGYAFDADGPISRMWVKRGNVTGTYPRLIDVLVTSKGKYFLFADGAIVYDAIGAAPVWLNDITTE